MSTGGDSAEEIVRLSLEGFEVVARISGSMAKNVAIMLYTMSKDTNKKTKGRTNLTNIMKSKSDLRVFSMKQEDFLKFKKEAKRYGILYCSLNSLKLSKKDCLAINLLLIIKRESNFQVLGKIIKFLYLISGNSTQQVPITIFIKL